jgi:hypothetical protein
VTVDSRTVVRSAAPDQSERVLSCSRWSRRLRSSSKRSKPGRDASISYMDLSCRPIATTSSRWRVALSCDAKCDLNDTSVSNSVG